MKLTMKNIGVIRDGEIELDGITVLAGLNGTGKSTTSKALYGIMTPYVNLSQKVTNERKRSVNHIIHSLLMDETSTSYYELYKRAEQVSSDLVENRLPVSERYEDWIKCFPELQEGKGHSLEKVIFPKIIEQLRTALNRAEIEYVQFLLNKTIEFVFEKQVNTIDFPETGEISLASGQGTQIARMKIKGNEVIECSGQEIKSSQPIYLDTRHVLDGINKPEKEPLSNSGLYYFLENPFFKPTLEEYYSQKRVLDMISSVIHGKLTISAVEEFMFKDDRFSEPISLRNVASGNKTFAVLQHLIERGALRENSILIIDEPESNQHPQWQLKLAETLVILHKELGVRLFLNTHSTYFLRAIEVYADQYELSNRCHYYQTQPVDGAEGLYHIRNVDGNTKLIYHDFYMPLEEL